MLLLCLASFEADSQTAQPSEYSACPPADLRGTPVVPVTGGQTRLRIFLDRYRATLEVPFHLADFCLHAVPVTRDVWLAATGSLPGPSDATSATAAPTEGSSPTEQQLPVTRITQVEAGAYCASVGGRLPTETEWEFAAAVSLTDRVAPDTGALPVSAEGLPLANLQWERDEYAQLSPVTAFDAGPTGLYDMIGNAAEWTSSSEVFRMRAWRYLSEGEAGDEAAVVYKGGSFADDPNVNRRWQPHVRSAAPRDMRLDDVGFRCAFTAAILRD
ncbi:MAG: formylglycine-generating enzyme family protein, partial [Myxococcales bacterium]|nr:formylglycine-generating enzyme family protein [Myxococcales bacterium]